MLEKAQLRSPEGTAATLAISEVDACRREVGRWEGVLSTYRGHLLSLSLAMHPFDLGESV